MAQSKIAYALNLWRAGVHPFTIEDLTDVSRSTLYRARTALMLLGYVGLLKEFSA